MSAPVQPATTRARADLHYGPLRRAYIPMISIELPSSSALLHTTLKHLSRAGWTNPAPVFRGTPMDCLAHAVIDGALSDQESISIGGAGLLLYQGPLERSAEWTEAARAADTITVLVSAGSEDLSALTHDGNILAANGVLFHRGQGVAAPANGQARPDASD